MNIAKLEQQFNRAQISLYDFKEAADYLKESTPELSTVIRRALLTAAICAYSRPFTANQSMGGLSKEFLVGGLEKTLPPEGRQMHDRILTLRHNAIAHSAYDHKPAELIGWNGGMLCATQHGTDVLKESLDLRMFKQLSHYMVRHCMEIVMDTAARIGRKHPFAISAMRDPSAEELLSRRE